MRRRELFHAGDGTSPLVCYDGERGAERAESWRQDRRGVLEAGRLDHRRARRRLRQKRYMGKMFGSPISPRSRSCAARSIRRPRHPGKVMPTPRLCGRSRAPIASTRSNGPGWLSAS